MEEMRKKVKQLEAELRKAKQVTKGEKPYEDTMAALMGTAEAARKSSSRDPALAEWNKSARLEKENGKLKQQLSEQERELERIRAVLDRANRNNDMLKKQMSEQKSATPQERPREDMSLERKVKVQEENDRLRQEVDKLKRSLNVLSGIPISASGSLLTAESVAIKGLQIKAEVLEGRCLELDKLLAEKHGPSVKNALEQWKLNQDEMSNLRSRNAQLDIDMQTLTSDNEHLRARNQDLQQYVDVLKEEIIALKSDNRSVMSDSSIRKVSVLTINVLS
ncbi:hypothetical protein Ciccas_006684 [Cichlidogyrus casuarinus]|uniref:Uncharacterized protein n=1 Tax=Cichlidogyrus casuarinus TaxID=1844966 RepID=A0ABD2Q593_9PLAT